VSGPRRELAAAVGLAFAALGTRVGFVTAYPTVPVSDFVTLVLFAEAFARDGFATGFWGWQYLNPGLPLGLSLVLRAVHGDLLVVARYTTAVVTGLAALCPFVIWRGAIALRARVAASLLLALCPGHVLASGVVSQDNWVLLPTVALASLATRVVVIGGPAWPVASALLWVAGGLVRQEMLIVSAPLALAGAGAFHPNPKRWRWLGRAALAAVVALSASAGLRWAGSGRFSLVTEHVGLAVLGAYSPGAASAYWTFPQAAVAALAPELVHNRAVLKERALGLAVDEALRRPGHHAIRIFSAIVNCQLRSDSNGLEWALGETSLPRSNHAAAAPLLERKPDAESAMVGLFGGFLAVTFLGLRRRAWPLMLIACVAFLKLGLHGMSTAQPRYFVPVTALALLSVGLAVDFPRGPPSLRQWVVGLVLGAASVSALRFAGERAEAYLLREEEQLAYRFELLAPSGSGTLGCVVDQGILVNVSPREATMRTLHVDPAPGETAVADCRATPLEKGVELVFEFDDPYADGGLPGRFVQSVAVEGREVLDHDLAAAPGSGPVRVPLGRVTPGRSVSVRLRVQAVSPDPDWSWGIAAATPFRLDRARGDELEAAPVVVAERP